MNKINLPNRITLFRIFIVPLIIVFLIKPSPFFSFLAALVFTVAAVSDWLDGHIARSTGQVTTLGKLLDPIADKILMVSVYVPLVALGRIPAWVATLLIGREFAVSGLRAVAASRNTIIPAGKMGKYKVGFEIAALEFLLLNWNIGFLNFQTVGMICLVIAMFLSLASATDYFLVYFNSKDPEDELKDS